MDMVKELFYGNLGVDALGVKKTSEYAKFQRRINTMVEDMEKHIPKEQCERLLNCIAELDYCISIAYFSLGFRWGARMIISVVTDDSETFEDL